MTQFYRGLFVRLIAVAAVACLLDLVCVVPSAAAPAKPGTEDARLSAEFVDQIKPLLAKHCLGCHSAEKKKGELDLRRFTSVELIRKDVKPWQELIERVGSGEMPPKDAAKPSDDERKLLVDWSRLMLADEARVHAGDPGPAVLRRLSNAEYDNTIRDLTGVDLHPTREFPADGAGGEGFTNAAEALSDISPALMDKYLGAAKDIASHAVLLPDGFRFSPANTQRDWTNETLENIRAFYTPFTTDGKLPLPGYLAATIRYREALLKGEIKLPAVAEREKLNAKYLEILWQTLSREQPSPPLSSIREHWLQASDKDTSAENVVAEIAMWQTKLIKIVPIGSYRDHQTARLIPQDPPKADHPNAQQFLDGCAEFRRVFPTFVCYPHIIPTDEVVCLKQFHRDDADLSRLFLNDQQQAQLERLWAEQRFISQWPISENKYLPLFIGFVSQDQPKELLKFYEGFREPFQKRAEEFQQEIDAAAPLQFEKLLQFAARAYRRPLAEKEQQQLRDLDQRLRDKGSSADEAFRQVLARILVSPSFLFRIEKRPPGKQPGPVSDGELASRLSYFLWSSMPDDELQRLAATGKLHEPLVLEVQTRRMLADPKLRALAIEFGAQWIHVRGFDQFNEKNERLFPTFDASLRAAAYEETIQFFQDFFGHDRPIHDLIDADYTYLNEQLAAHYNIPGVSGPQWRKVDGVRKYGRGGILALASVQAKESGASRTSPILRGNWIVETLLGEKLPRPPADVPKLPKAETGNAGLTVRQLVTKHTQDAACAVCHVRIDPFGFSLEKYDAIGRLRQKDMGGIDIDTQVKVRDGAEFDGIDGLRGYLLSNKKDVVYRLFCRRLLGYALGRSVQLSDQPLIDEMLAALDKHDGQISAAVLVTVRSPQFTLIRGQDFPIEESPR